MYCMDVPPYIRDVVLKLQERENANASANNSSMYGSRKVFFGRLWTRMHGGAASAATEDDGDDKGDVKEPIYQQNKDSADDDDAAAKKNEATSQDRKREREEEKGEEDAPGGKAAEQETRDHKRLEAAGDELLHSSNGS
jgi:hypothetical protein